ncbi:hypothetical protein [Pendulispora albinea]|uniref:Uncharacterized protein n=1 Tax=Pendulispora albinea TaxID=2741071 RepID=A0ABZ2LVL6_9BACT
MQTWRMWIGPVGDNTRIRDDSSGSGTSRWALPDAPLFHIIYNSFNAAGASSDAPRKTSSQSMTRSPARTWQELNQVLYEAVEAGVLKWEQYEVPWPFPAMAETPEHGRPAGESQAWIAIELVTKKDASPVAEARYAIKVPDGSRRSGSLDDQGRARVERIDAGVCHIDFPDYVPREWGAPPIQGRGFDDSVEQGGCIASTAKQLNFADWHTIYDAPENEEFRTLRPHPNVLFVGDRIHIPSRDAEPVTRSTEPSLTYALTQTNKDLAGDGAFAHNANMLLINLEDLAIVPLVESNPTSPKARVDTVTQAVEAELVLRRKSIARRDKLLDDRTPVPIETCGHPEKEPPPRRVCGEAYVLMRQIVNFGKSGVDARVDARMFLHAPDDFEDAQIARARQSGIWNRALTGQDFEDYMENHSKAGTHPPTPTR